MQTLAITVLKVTEYRYNYLTQNVFDSCYKYKSETTIEYPGDYTTKNVFMSKYFPCNKIVTDYLSNYLCL